MDLVGDQAKQMQQQACRRPIRPGSMNISPRSGNSNAGWFRPRSGKIGHARA